MINILDRVRLFVEQALGFARKSKEKYSGDIDHDQIIILHATLQQREQHHIECLALLNRLLNERFPHALENDRSTNFWMISQVAAIDKAKEIGLDIQPEWSAADLRYKLHQAIYGGDNG